MQIMTPQGPVSKFESLYELRSQGSSQAVRCSTIFALSANHLELVMDAFRQLRERRTQLAGTLSGREQQMPATGRALMAHPEVLLFR